MGTWGPWAAAPIGLAKSSQSTSMEKLKPTQDPALPKAHGLAYGPTTPGWQSLQSAGDKEATPRTKTRFCFVFFHHGKFPTVLRSIMPYNILS